MGKEPVVILGAGVGGLAVGWFLARTGRYEVTLIERAPVIGGHCGSFVHNGFTLDYGPHKMYSVIPGVLDELCSLMAGRLIEHRKRHSIRLNGHLLDYPLRMGNLARVLGPQHFLRLGASYGMALVQGLLAQHEPASYAEYVIRRFGREVYQLVFEPLAWKVWGDPTELHPEMARTRIPASGAAELILTLLKLKRESGAINAEFFYYPRKGFGDLPQAMAEAIAKHDGRIFVNARISHIECANRRIESVAIQVRGNSLKLPCRYLVSSLPLPVLGQLVYGDGDPEFTQAVTSLRFRHLVLVYLFLNRPKVLDDHWIFFPEREFIFNRVFEQKLLSAELGPPDCTALCCDLTCSSGDEIWNARDGELAARCVTGLTKAGFILPEQVQSYLVKRSENFYPVYDLAYAENMKIVSRKLQRTENLLTTGRIGMYNYNNSDHCVDMGRFIAEKLVQGDPPSRIWEQLEKRVATYKIVD